MTVRTPIETIKRLSLIFQFNWRYFVRPSPPRYPLDSMAVANSSARLNELTNKGTSSGTIDLTLSFIGPDEKSTPLAVWAFMIFSVSSISVGMKRSAMDIINASSCTGIFHFFKGPNSSSIPSVMDIGDVVKVKSDVTRINNVNLTDMKKP